MSAEPSWAQIAADAKTAIRDILTKGVSYSAEGRSMTRADLGQLRELATYAEQMAKRDAAGGIPVRAGTPVDA